MLLLLLAALAAIAGDDQVDIELRVRYCPEIYSFNEYRLFKHQGTVSVHKDLTQADYHSLVASADAADCAPFAVTATTLLGSWYTDLGTEDRETVCVFFDRLDP